MNIAVDKYGERGRPRPRWLAAVLATMAACGGCWEEIHYAPPADTSEQAQAPSDANPAAEGERTTDGEPVAQDATTPPPLTSDLFPTRETPPETPPMADEAGAALDEQDAEDAVEANSILPTPTAPAAESEMTGDGAAPPPPVSPPTPGERRKAWQAVSQWSLGAALHAKDLAHAPQAAILAEASAIAAELGIEFPALPTPAQEENLEAAVIEGLRGELSVAVANAYANRFGEAAAAAADLAIRSRLLLLTYLPRNADASMAAEGLRRAGEASGLPSEIWAPLVALVEERVPFLEVRQAVFDLHRDVEEHLASAAESSSEP